MASEAALGSAKGLGATSPAADGGLVELCQKGDPQAFARLVALHESMVFNLAARLLGDVEEARDVSQDVFLQVFRALGRFQGRSSLKTWIYRIVVNQCRNRRRFWRRRGAGCSCSIDALTPGEEARAAAGRDEGKSPFDAVARRERAGEVQRALLTISFEHRAVLLLREVDGLSCEEIAASLGVALGTVKSRLARAREAFRRAFAPLPSEVRP